MQANAPRPSLRPPSDEGEDGSIIMVLRTVARLTNVGSIVVAGMLFLASAIWIIDLGVRATVASKSVASTLLGAIACGRLVQLPLATITSGSLDFSSGPMQSLVRPIS